MGLLHMLSVYIIMVISGWAGDASVITCATLCTCIALLNVHVHFRIV